MLAVREFIDQARSLPVEERAVLVDSLLKTLNTPDETIDRQWIEVSKRRLAELRSGAVKSIPGDEVFETIRKRFAL